MKKITRFAVVLGSLAAAAAAFAAGSASIEPWALVLISRF